MVSARSVAIGPLAHVFVPLFSRLPAPVDAQVQPGGT